MSDWNFNPLKFRTEIPAEISHVIDFRVQPGVKNCLFGKKKKKKKKKKSNKNKFKMAEKIQSPSAENLWKRLENNLDGTMKKW